MSIHKILGTTALIGTVVVAGCTDATRFDPASADRNQTATGAIIGGIAGAIAGRATSNDSSRDKATILGAAVGAGAGALIGQQLDKQEAELRASMGQNVRITNTGEELIVALPDSILFAVDSAVVTAASQQNLFALSNNLRANPGSNVQIIGHTDNTGSAAYNLGLSQRRAEAVANVLIQNGVSPARLQSFGRGEDAPVATNLTPEGQALNRRVEVVIKPIV